MSNVRKFDEMAVVVDWIDAFKNRHLDALLDLYEDTATIEMLWGRGFSRATCGGAVLGAETVPIKVGLIRNRRPVSGAGRRVSGLSRV